MLFWWLFWPSFFTLDLNSSKTTTASFFLDEYFQIYQWKSLLKYTNFSEIMFFRNSQFWVFDLVQFNSFFWSYKFIGLVYKKLATIATLQYLRTHSRLILLQTWKKDIDEIRIFGITFPFSWTWSQGQARERLRISGKLAMIKVRFLQ